MTARSFPAAPRGQRGATLIEVLVSLFILMVGLLGLVGVMIQSQRAQLESYQRVQALMLVQDMAARIAANKAVASCYVLTDYIGMDKTTVPAATTCAITTPTNVPKDRMVQDLTEWRNLLQGATESAAGNPAGGVLGARGCIANDPSGIPNMYQVSIAWQGAAATSAPPAGISCAQGQYGTDDAARRAVSVVVQVS